MPSSIVSKIVFLLYAYGYNIFTYFLIYYEKFRFCISQLRRNEPRHTVPPAENPLLLMSATALAAGIRSGKIKSQDVVRCYIARIKQVQPQIFALAENRFTQAIKEARLVDFDVASGVRSPEVLRDEKPLLGVPFSVKMVFCAKGLQSGNNLEVLKLNDNGNDADAISIAQMKKAGAISIISTTAQYVARNINSAKYGEISNPYDTRRNVGGSTGGEAAMIAACGSVIGIGTDISGSLRTPAFFTGVFSHKSSRGVVSNRGILGAISESSEDLLTVGPLCRYAEDLTLCMKILTHSHQMKKKMDKQVNFRELKIYYTLDYARRFFAPPMQKEIPAAMKKAMLYFEKTYDVKSQKLNVDNLKYITLIISFLGFSELKKNIHMQITSEIEIGIYGILKNIMSGKNKTTPFYLILCYLSSLNIFAPSILIEYCKELLEKMKNELVALLDENSVLLCPTSLRTALYHKETEMLMVPSVQFVGIFNHFGFPVSQCPAGLDKEGLPIGFQVAANVGNDHLTIACAREIEKCFGGWTPPWSTNNMEIQDGITHADMFGDFIG